MNQVSFYQLETAQQTLPSLIDMVNDFIMSGNHCHGMVNEFINQIVLWKLLAWPATKI